MKTIILTLAFAFAIISTQAQTLTPSEVPAAARAHFDKTHTELQYAPDWKKVGDNYVVEYEVHFIPNFNTYDANGKFLDTKVKTMVKFFPACIKDQLNKKYAGSKMKKAEVLTNAENKTFYLVEVQGKKLQFDNSCQLVSSINTQTTQSAGVTER